MRCASETRRIPFVNVSHDMMSGLWFRCGSVGRCVDRRAVLLSPPPPFHIFSRTEDIRNHATPTHCSTFDHHRTPLPAAPATADPRPSRLRSLQHSNWQPTTTSIVDRMARNETKSVKTPLSVFWHACVCHERQYLSVRPRRDTKEPFGASRSTTERRILRACTCESSRTWWPFLVR